MRCTCPPDAEIDAAAQSALRAFRKAQKIVRQKTIRLRFQIIPAIVLLDGNPYSFLTLGYEVCAGIALHVSDSLFLRHFPSDTAIDATNVLDAAVSIFMSWMFDNALDLSAHGVQPFLWRAPQDNFTDSPVGYSGDRFQCPAVLCLGCDKWRPL